ncbi:SRPBCC family protein [Streptomyces sp. NPDC048595]|uniref:SRPBCC family protein n=1 Tax=Streptomyces sp. NPDC048595 TaxID=3365576 RepID=UPI00371144D5
MTETQRFVAQATVTVNALVHDIWAVWVDVNAWKTWDDGIDSTQLHGNFKAGNSYTLTPQGGPPLKVTLTSVTQGEEFSDETVLPFGTLVTHHRMEPLGSRIKVTHELVADIAGDSVPAFARDVWPHLQSGLSQSLVNLADLVGSD